MKSLVSSYTFSAAGKTVVFNDRSVLALQSVLLITNVTRNVIIYNFSDPLKGGSATGNVLTLDFDTSSMADADILQVYVDAVDAAVSINGDISDQTDNAMVVQGSPQTVYRVNFTDASASGLSTSLLQMIGTLGAGQTVSQSASNLVITAGTTANAETVIRSTRAWSGGLRCRWASLLSQRIANNTFRVELTDVVGDALSCTWATATALVVTIPNNPFTAANVGQSVDCGNFAGTGTFVPARYAIASVAGNNVTFTVSGFSGTGSGTCSLTGWNYEHVIYDGTTATTAKFDCQYKGYAQGDTSATISTTASPGHIGEIVSNDGMANFLDQVANVSGAGLRQTGRASRDINVPDNIPLYLQIRVVNGATAPASSTTWSINFVQIANFAAIDTILADTRAQTTANAMPVYLANTTVDTELPAAATLADAVTNPSTSQVGADQMDFNGTTWDRHRPAALNVNIDTSAAKTATFNGATATNFGSARGVKVVIMTSAVGGTTPTLVAKLQYSPDNGTTWIDWDTTNLQTLTINTNTNTILMVYPGLTNTANSMKGDVLPRTWRVVYTIGGSSPTFTISTWAMYLP